MDSLSHGHGSSGAIIQVDPFADFVMKLGDDRVVQQGDWLTKHESPAVPRVTGLVTGGYFMEKLHELPRDLEWGRALFVRMVDQLQGFIWANPAEVMFDEVTHLQKVIALADRFLTTDQRFKMFRLYEMVNWDKLTACLTHGDPTVDNVLIREIGDVHDRDIVLADPIPATPAIPDLRVVDLAKLLQSAHGFERIKYREPGLVIDLDEIFDLCADRNERRALRYMDVVNMLRVLPYQSKEVQRDILQTPPLANLA